MGGIITSSRTSSSSRTSTSFLYPLKRSSKINLNESYSVGSIIGIGGFAIIKELQDKKTLKWYAMKVFQINSLNKKEALIILNELLIYKRIQTSPFIISLYTSFQTNTTINFIIDLLTGGDLRFLIRRNEIFNEKKISYIISCIGSALNHLHCHKIIHRDVKPENIVFNSHGIPKLVDFGMSYLLPDNTDICVCQHRSGTREYLAPEACVSKTHYHGYEVDFWSLGIILFELLFKRRPFECMVPYSMVKYSDETYKHAWESLIQQSLLPPNRRVTRTSSMLTLDCFPTSPGVNSLLSESNINHSISSSSQKYSHHSHQQHQQQYFPLNVSSFIPQNSSSLSSELTIFIPQVAANSETVTQECINILTSLLDVRIHKRIGVYDRYSLFASHQWFINNGYPASKLLDNDLIQSPIVPQLDEVSFQIWTQFYEKNIQNFQESVIKNHPNTNNNNNNNNNNNKNTSNVSSSCKNSCKNNDANNAVLSQKEMNEVLENIEYISPLFGDPNVITPNQPITYAYKIHQSPSN